MLAHLKRDHHNKCKLSQKTTFRSLSIFRYKNTNSRMDGVNLVIICQEHIQLIYKPNELHLFPAVFVYETFSQSVTHIHTWWSIFGIRTISSYSKMENVPTYFCVFVRGKLSLWKCRLTSHLFTRSLVNILHLSWVMLPHLVVPARIQHQI